MSEQAHTPWRAEYIKAPGSGWRIVNSLGDLVAQGTHSMFDERDFPFIVRAVNTHTDMLAVLKLAATIIGHPDDSGSKLIAETIAKAEGRS